MADTSHRSPPDDAPPERTSHLEDIEQDLDNVDEALAALDSGDLDAAETLAAELDSPGAGTPDDDQRGGNERRPAGPAC